MRLIEAAATNGPAQKFSFDELKHLANQILLIR